MSIRLRRASPVEENRHVALEPSSHPRPARPEPRDVVELKRLRTTHPELAPAVNMQLELAELQRRVQGRLRTPMLQRHPADIHARVSAGLRQIDFQDLLVDWSDFRLIFRQTADILHRAGAIEPADHTQLQYLVREATRIEPLVRDYYERTSRPDRYKPAAAEVPAMLDEVAALSLAPFLTRCAEAWRPHVSLADYQEGWCPMCGLHPEFATLVDGDRLLICGRCRTQWPFPSEACPFCTATGSAEVSSFATRDGRYRVYGCNRCRKYLKAYDARGASRPVLPAVDTIATLPLDAAAIQRGYDG